MKLILTIVTCFCFIHLQAQNKYSDKIGVVKELNIYGGNAKIIIGSIIVNETLTTKLYLLKSTQIKDTSGYTTTFYLGNPESIPLFNANLIFKFSKAVDTIDCLSEAGVMSEQSGFIDDHITYLYRAGQVNRGFNNPSLLLTCIIKSKEKISTKISGTDGYLR